jgi:hypothetical protein
MGQAEEIASFRIDDVDPLVAASLACSRCLSSDVGWLLEHARWDARVHCHCQVCDHRRTIFLRPDQALRLSLNERRPFDPDARPLDPNALL